MAGATQKHRDLAISTVLGPDALVLERVSGAERLGQPFEYRAVAFAEEDNFSFDDLVGTRAVVRIEMGEPGVRYLNGVVSQVRHVGHTIQGRSRYELVMVPWIWLLGRTSDCRIFQNKTVPEIIREIFSENGHSDFKLQLQGSYAQRVYCVQYRETDLNFVQRLIEHEGIYYYTEHEQAKHTLVFSDSMSTHKPAAGFESLRYRARETGLRDEIRVHSWQVSKQITPGAYGVNSFDFESPVPSPASRLIGMSQQAHSFKEGEAEMYDNPGDYVERSEGERYARVRREELQSETEVASGQTDARGLIPGVTFKLEDNPKESQNREYLVISFAFHAECGNYETSGGSGEETYEASFSCIPKAAVFRPSRTAHVPVVKGPQTALVVGPSGEEIHTDRYGRVKVQFLWDRYGKFDGGSSCWIRVAQVWAGKGWGGMAIPRIGQEVIVDFLEGDPDRPIITGRVYNGDSMPPYDLPANATRTTLKSNSSKGGGGFNEIRIEDKKGKEQIFVHAERNRDLRVKKDNLEWIGENEHLIVKEDRHLKIEGDEHRDVKGELNEKVGESVSLKVGQNLQQKSGQRIAQQAGQEIHLKAGMNVVIEAGMSITLKAGGGFIVVGPAGVTISGTPVLINSGGAAGSGGGCSPTPPKAAKEADDDKPGGETSMSGGSKPKKKGPPSPTSIVLKQAAASGTPFCEVCQKG